MLTIKNVLPNGSENVFEAEAVHFLPGSARIPEKSVVWIGPKEGSRGSEFEFDLGFDEGTVYVMNPAGKTIATYHLEYSSMLGDGSIASSPAKTEAVYPQGTEEPNRNKS